ncbi:hypothetical protein BGW80DRAFT_1458501 [Lactifluus volemus]|nr:hypothetical protein BGW80DRAFT_1458501 [Lactifluus volemus]
MPSSPALSGELPPLAPSSERRSAAAAGMGIKDSGGGSGSGSGMTTTRFHPQPLHRRGSTRPSNTADDPSAPLPLPSPASSARECSIPAVFSSEIPSDDVTFLVLANSELAMGSVDELVPLLHFHACILPMLGPLPALFGLHIATYTL